MKFIRSTYALLAIAIACVSNAQAKAKPDAITAVDILLLPDATMLKHAQATNDRLLKVYPKGFSLDASHIPTLPWCSDSFAPRISTKSMPPSAKSSPVPM